MLQLFLSLLNPCLPRGLEWIGLHFQCLAVQNISKLVFLYLWWIHFIPEKICSCCLLQFVTRIQVFPNHICLSGWGIVIYYIFHLKLRYLIYQYLFMSHLLIEYKSLFPVNIQDLCPLSMVSAHNSLPPCSVLVYLRSNFRIFILCFVVVFS